LTTKEEISRKKRKEKRKTHQQRVSWHKEHGNAVHKAERHSEIAYAAARGMAT